MQSGGVAPSLYFYGPSRLLTEALVVVLVAPTWALVGFQCVVVFVWVGVFMLGPRGLSRGCESLLAFCKSLRTLCESLLALCKSLFAICDIPLGLFNLCSNRPWEISRPNHYPRAGRGKSAVPTTTLVFFRASSRVAPNEHTRTNITHKGADKQMGARPTPRTTHTTKNGFHEL